MIIFKFCPNCKNILKKSKEKQECTNCGFTHYVNPVAAASVLPIKDGKVLISVRKNDPYKGEYDLIGGFLQPNESAEAGAIRETLEETGLKVEIIRLLGTYPDKYGKDGNYTLNIQFIVRITNGDMKAKDDVSKLEWIDITDIPKLKLKGFQNTRDTLKDLYTSYKNKELQ